MKNNPTPQPDKQDQDQDDHHYSIDEIREIIIEDNSI
jgi:hypothetical protein